MKKYEFLDWFPYSLVRRKRKDIYTLINNISISTVEEANSIFLAQRKEILAINYDKENIEEFTFIDEDKFKAYFDRLDDSEKMRTSIEKLRLEFYLFHMSQIQA